MQERWARLYIANAIERSEDESNSVRVNQVIHQPHLKIIIDGSLFNLIGKHGVGQDECR